MAEIFLPNENNAIIRLNVTLALAKPLQPNDFAEIDKHYKDFKDDFPRRERENELATLTLSATGIEQTPKNPSQDGFTGMRYELFNREGSVARGVRVSGNLLQISIGDYSCWENKADYVGKIVRKFLSYLVNENHLNSVQVHIIDEFVFDPYDSFVPSKFLNPKSVPLPSYVFENTLNWHVHTGAFVDPGNQDYRQLDKVNVDVIDDDSDPVSRKRKLRLTFVHLALYDLPSEKFEQPSVSQMLKDEAIFAAVFDNLHAKNVTMLKDIIGEDLKARLKGLNDGD